jgi:hypothetical protein
MKKIFKFFEKSFSHYTENEGNNHEIIVELQADESICKSDDESAFESDDADFEEVRKLSEKVERSTWPLDNFCFAEHPFDIYHFHVRKENALKIEQLLRSRGYYSTIGPLMLLSLLK